jgi:exosortase/archaeosortase family protein
MASLLFGELYRLRWPWRAALVGLGLATAFELNLGRTFFLASMASSCGLGAIDKFHDQAGLSVLVVCVLALWFIAARLPKPTSVNSSAASGMPPTCPRWLPLAVLGGLVLIELITFAWYQRRPVELVPNARWEVAWPTNRVAFERLEFPEAMRNLLAADRGESAMWYEPDGSRWTLYFLRWNPGPLSTRILARAHRPDFCLPSSGYRMVADHGLRRFTVGGLEIPFRGFTFRHEDRVLQVFFCLWEDQRPKETQLLLSGYTPTNGRLKAILEGRQDSLGHQTLEFVTAGYPDFATAEQTLRQLLTSVVRPAP